MGRSGSASGSSGAQGGSIAAAGGGRSPGTGQGVSQTGATGAGAAASRIQPGGAQGSTTGSGAESAGERNYDDRSGGSHLNEKPDSTGPNSRPRDESIGQTGAGFPDDSSKPIELDDAEADRIEEAIRSIPRE